MKNKFGGKAFNELQDTKKIKLKRRILEKQDAFVS